MDGNGSYGRSLGMADNSSQDGDPLVLSVSGCRYNLISLYDIVYHCPFSGLSQKIPEDYSVCFCVRAMQSAGRGQWIFYAFFFRFRCNMIIF